MNAILDDLTPAQREAAIQSGPVLVIAGAGTGKTKTLTAAVAHRIADRGMPANRVLAVTFTNKAAAEMTGRIRMALGDGAAPHWTGTFHGLGARQLRIEPEVADLRPGFDILDADDTRRMIKRVMKSMNLGSGDDEGRSVRDPLKLVCNRISKWKDELITPADAPAAAERLIAQANAGRFAVDPPGLRAAARVYAEYQRILRDANAADFGDLLLWPVRAMMLDWAYRARWANRFACVLATNTRTSTGPSTRGFGCYPRCTGNCSRSATMTRACTASEARTSLTSVALPRTFRGPRRSDSRRISGAQDPSCKLPTRSSARSCATSCKEPLYTRNARRALPIEDPQFPQRRSWKRLQDRDGDRCLTRRAEGSVAWDEIAILYRNGQCASSRPVRRSTDAGAHPLYACHGDVGFYQRLEIKDALALLRLAATSRRQPGGRGFPARHRNTPAARLQVQRRALHPRAGG